MVARGYLIVTLYGRCLACPVVLKVVADASKQSATFMFRIEKADAENQGRANSED